MSERLGEIELEMATLRRQLSETEWRLTSLAAAREDASRIADLLTGFDEIWNALIPEERREVVHLLVKSVTLDLDQGGVRIAFHDLGDPADDPTEVES